jgi:hypothetical protein
MDRYRLTDSPWFWGLMFSVMALVGIGLIAPKFDKRQRQVEGRFLGRQQSAIERERRAAGLPPVDLADTAQDRELVTPQRIVPLWTLAIAAGAAAAGSAVMLRREIRHNAAAAIRGDAD